MDFKKLIDEIPAYDHFLTVDEMDASTLKLAEDYPDLVSVTQEGTSRGGHPIYCLKIGDGPKNAFMFGCPHPNEPSGRVCCWNTSHARWLKTKICARSWIIPGI